MAQEIINTGAAANDGTGDPLRTAFIKTDNNFDQIWAAGPVGTNVRISGNTITTLTVNTDLALSPNGAANVRLNNNTIPGANNTWYLGSVTNRWRGVYVGSAGLDIAGNLTVSGAVDFPGDMTVGGNLTIEGDTIQIGNIVTDTKTIQLANTAATDAAADGSGITVGASDDIATLLYNSTNNEWRMNIGANVSGNVSANYFIGNGALLTGVTSYGDANVAAYLPNYNGDIQLDNITMFGNINGGLRQIQLGTLPSGNLLIVDDTAFNGPGILTPGGSGLDLLIEPSGNLLLSPDGGEVIVEKQTASTNFNTGALLVYGGIGADGNINISGNVGAAGWTGNLIPSANAVYSLGNATNYWSNLWVANNTIYIGGVPLGVTGNVLTVNGEAVLSNDSDATITTTGNITANYFIGDGSQLTNVASTGNFTFSGTTMSADEMLIETADGDITITAEDDVNIRGGDKVPGSDSGEGGDIDITGGDGRIDNGVSAGSGGDIAIEGGLGGHGVSSGAGTGGGIILQAGQGGDANVGNAVQAGEGGQILIQGGDGGDNAGDNSLSGIGGNVEIYGGSGSFDFGNTIPNGAPGHVNLYGGNWGYNFAPTGNIYLNTYDGTNFKTLSYDYNGNVTMAPGGGLNFVGSNPGIVQSPDEDFKIRVQDADDDDFAVILEVDDGAGNALGQTILKRDQFQIYYPQPNLGYNFNENGQMEIPGNIRTNDYTDASLYAVSDNDGNGTVELKVISFSGDLLGSNVRVTQSNAYISTANAAHTWTFDDVGNLTMPGNIRMGNADASAVSQINTVANSSGDGMGYTTLQLIPDETLTGGDQYLIIDPTIDTHIHIRAGGPQDDSSADLFLGGENSYVKLPAGSNPNVEISANTLVWTFGSAGVNGELTLPAGEGAIKVVDDSLSLVSFNTTSGNANSVYLGSSGGLGFFDGEIGGNWLQIFRSGAEPEITVPVGSGSANLYINNSSSGNVRIWNFGAAGDLTAPGNIAANYFVGNGSALTGLTYNQTGNIVGDQANVILVAGSYNTVFDNTGNVTLPGNLIFADSSKFASASWTLIESFENLNNYATSSNSSVTMSQSFNTYAAQYNEFLVKLKPVPEHNPYDRPSTFTTIALNAVSANEKIQIDTTWNQSPGATDIEPAYVLWSNLSSTGLLIHNPNTGSGDNPSTNLYIYAR